MWVFPRIGSYLGSSKNIEWPSNAKQNIWNRYDRKRSSIPSFLQKNVSSTGKSIYRWEKMQSKSVLTFSGIRTIEAFRKSVLSCCWEDEHHILITISQQGIWGQWLGAMTHKDAGLPAPAPAWVLGLTPARSLSDKVLKSFPCYDEHNLKATANYLRTLVL